MNEGAVFCDSLSWRSALALARSGASTVRVLDELPAGPGGRLLRALLGFLGCTAVETEFFAGHLRDGDGEPAYIVASRKSSEVALAAARSAVAESAQLGAVNEQVGRDRVVLRIARQLWIALGRQVLQIHVAQALAGPQRAVLWLARPTRYDPRVLDGICAGVEIRCYGGGNPLLERARMAGWVISLAAKDFRWRLAAGFGPAPHALRDVHGRPGVLLVQEDEISSDPSYRSQPHWFPAAGEAPLPFATYLVAAGARSTAPGAVPPDLTILDARAIGGIDRHFPDDTLVRRLSGDARRCLALTLTANRDWMRASYAVAARLLLRAAILAKICRFLNVRAFLTGEPYLLDCDAMTAIGRDAGVTTLAYQYSNVGYGNVILATTSDQMLLFSERYEQIWSYAGIRPQRFGVTGYLFDAAFVRVRSRAAELRRSLEATGARFVITYFDENVGPPKYGFIAPWELDGEIRMLAQRVLDNPDLGVIFKSQFLKRSPTVRLADDPLLHAAIGTGRMIDLYAGTHRNVVLPAEAALASDIALSQIVGGTAALEAALTGTRCVLINHNGMHTANDELYRSAQVVFHSFDEALSAIDAFRSGDARYRALGDWSPFIRELDPFRDGRAAARLRDALEAAACGERPAAEERPALLREAHG